MVNWLLTFPSNESAERALKQAGFSIGRRQASAPRGILFGDQWDIQKWRNLSVAHKEALHGELHQVGPRGGEVRVVLRHRAVPREAFLKLYEVVNVLRLEKRGCND